MDVGLVVALALGVVVVPIAILTARHSRAIQRAKASDPSKFEGYHGLHYANPKDERLWVPKLSGMGWTINFSHRWAWPVMVLLVGVPVVTAVVGIVFAQRH